MDVVEILLYRLPPNWWWAIHPADCQHSDFVFKLPSFPFSFEFMMLALGDAGLLSRASITKEVFNSRFQGKLEVADMRRLGSKKLLL